MAICKLLPRSACSFATLSLLLALASCERKGSSTQAEPAPNASSQGSELVHDAKHPLEINVTSEGFVPARAKVKVGEPVTLIVTRKVENTCATDLVIKDYGINKPLPTGTRVEVTFTPKAPGPIGYACAMDMVKGELLAE
jgi:plastocyanin domain-containing protein